MTLHDLFYRLFRRQYETNYTCELCHREVFDNAFFCEDCKKLLPWNGKAICPVCGRRVEEASLCLECKQYTPVYTKARSVFVYEGHAANLINAFKNGSRYLSVPFGREMRTLLQSEFPDADFLVAVPMTKKARRARGYSQSELLATYLSELTDVPFERDVLEKTRETKPQKTLSRRDRMENVRGCFHVHRRSACLNRSIVLVDDILTTGSTADELARVLKGAGAKRVYVLTACSTPSKA